MIDFFKTITDYIGTANLLAIILFLISLFITGYFYFKTFYRLVYSTSTICPNCKEIGDFIKKNNHYKTRVLFYNNGRKTLTKEENKELIIISENGQIKDAKVLKGENIDLANFENKIDIQFDYLDSKNLFIIEIEHTGHLTITGRISESGKILNTEPKMWVILNIIPFIISIALIYYTAYELLNFDTLTENIPIGLNLIMVFLIMFFMRFIHGLFFIPDNISSKYLNSKNKIQNEFAINL